jgi:hypothetical protein
MNGFGNTVICIDIFTQLEIYGVFGDEDSENKQDYIP